MPGAEYPFGRAPGSFFLGGGEALARAYASDGAAAPPLLAYGANASPERLAGKLGGAPAAALAGTLGGWAVVHSAHVSPYGAVPATIVPEPGAVAAVHVLLLDARGRALLDVTEPNYDRVRLEPVELEVEHLGRVPAVEAYVSKWGALELGGRTVAVGSRPQAELLRVFGR